METTEPNREVSSHTPPRALASASKWRRVLGLAGPALVQQLFFFIIQIYDQYLASFFTEEHTSALNTANYLYWAVTSYTALVSVGATAVVSRFVGASNYPMANRAVGQSLILAAICGSFAALVGLLGIGLIVRSLGLTEGAADYAEAYLRPLAGMLPFYLVEVGGIACLIGAGDTRTGLRALGGVVCVNVPLAWFLSQSSLGFLGIAWGTGISHSLGCLFVLSVLFRGRFSLRLTLPNLIPDFALLYRLLRVSVPAAMDSLSTTVGQLWFVSIINNLGNIAASAHGIAIRCEGLGYLSGAAFGIAAMSLVGQNLGAKQPGHAARDAWTAFGAGLVVMSLMGVIFFTFAREMLGLFSPEKSHDEIVNAGVPALQLVAFAMPAVASTIIITSSLRGAGDTRVPMIFTWAGFFGVRIPLAYWLTGAAVDLGPLGTFEGANLGLIGAWWAMFADLYFRATLLIIRFAGGWWKTARV